MKYIFPILLIFLFNYALQAQQNFSQYTYAPGMVNPALISSQNDIRFTGIYHRQQFASDVSFNTSLISFSSPILNGKRQRVAAAGITLYDDRWGAGKQYVNQSGKFNFSYIIPLDSFTFISAGLIVETTARKISFDNISTGTQYMEGKGYDPSSSSGENLTSYRKNFFSIHNGIVLYRSDKKFNTSGYIGLALYDINKANTSLTETKYRLPRTVTFNTGLRMKLNELLYLYPDYALWINTYSSTHIVGGTLRYTLDSKKEKNIQVASRYNSNKSLELSFQYMQSNYVFGFGYNFGLNAQYAQKYQSSTEVMIIWRKPLKEKFKKIKKKKADVKSSPQIRENKIPKVDEPVQSTDTLKKVKKIKIVRVKMEEEPDTLRKDQSKQGILLKNLEFEFNSSEILGDAKIFLDSLTDFMENNPNVKLLIIGHTDNLGKKESNELVSLERARQAKEYLMRQGISPNLLLIDGKGTDEPIADNKTERGRRKNRRVEFRIIEK